MTAWANGFRTLFGMTEKAKLPLSRGLGGCTIAKKHPPCPPQRGDGGNKQANFKNKNNIRRKPKILIKE